MEQEGDEWGVLKYDIYTFVWVQIIKDNNISHIHASIEDIFNFTYKTEERPWVLQF